MLDCGAKFSVVKRVAMTCGWLSLGSHTNAAKLWQCYQAKDSLNLAILFKPGSEYDMSQVPNAESSLLRKLKLYNWELDPFSLFQESLQLSIARAFF